MVNNLCAKLTSFGLQKYIHNTAQYRCTASLNKRLHGTAQNKKDHLNEACDCYFTLQNTNDMKNSAHIKAKTHVAAQRSLQRFESIDF